MESESALPFSAVKKVNFTNSDDEELIEKVSGYEILWKLNHPDYKTNMKKDVIWNKIGVTLNKTGWRNIRDNFKRHRKPEVSRTGKPAKKRRATYWNSLRFLDDIEDERQGLSNTEEPDMSFGGISNGNETDDSSANEEKDNNTEPKDQPSVSVCAEQNCSKERSEEMKKPPITKKIKSNNIVIEMMKRKEETQGKLVECVGKLITEDQKEEDDIDAFLKSVGLTIKQFTPAEKAEAKRKFFNVVSDLEIRHYSNPGTNLQTVYYSTSPSSSSAMSHNSRCPANYIDEMESELQ